VTSLALEPNRFLRSGPGLRLRSSLTRRSNRLLLAVGRAAGADEIEPPVLDRARQGDHRAFATIVEHYDERLRALAYRLLGDRDRMDDALQEAYLRAFRALDSFKGEAAFGTWLYRITYNVCMDDLRHRRDVVSLDDDERPEEASPLRGPAETVVEREDLAAALGALPPEQRAAVLLVDADGFDYGEAATIMGVPGGTVASRLNRGRAALRRALGSDES
jgi:RNA polymerase sigma-70 factor (ECF subfamily)